MTEIPWTPGRAAMFAPKKGDLSPSEKELFEVISAGKLLELIPVSFVVDKNLMIGEEESRCCGSEIHQNVTVSDQQLCRLSSYRWFSV